MGELETLRERLRQMNNAELRRCGRETVDMVRSAANVGKNRRDLLTIQLDEIRIEMKRDP
jgi:hypothetical protein